MLNLEQINEYLEKIDGNHSEFYRRYNIQEIENNYPEEDMAFWSEFMFFEDKYLICLKHMLENSIKGDIIDIGCQNGFQSEFFKNDRYSYIGVDCFDMKDLFYNVKEKNISYQIGCFCKDLHLKDVKPKNSNNKIILSIMSLGYFNKALSDDKENYEKIGNKMIVEELKDEKFLYISTTQDLLNELVCYFDHYEILSQKNIMGENFSVVFFKKNIETGYPLCRPRNLFINPKKKLNYKELFNS